MHEPDDEPDFDESVFGPPDGVLGAATILQAVVLHDPDRAVVIDDVIVYPTGFTFSLVVIDAAAARHGEHDQDPGWWPAGDRSPGDAIREPRCRLRFPEGTYVSPDFTDSDDPLTPQITSLGGGGSDTRSETTYWVTPLPSPGRLTFEARWPDSDDPPGSVTIDADVLLDAVSRTVRIWDDD